MDLAKRFSLNTLITGSNQPAQPASRSDIGALAMEEAIKAYVTPVLSVLEVAPDKKQRLFTIFDAVHANLPESGIDDFRNVVKWMQGVKLIKVVEPDSHGNDLIKKFESPAS